MYNFDIFNIYYDIVAYIVAFRSLIDELLYKLNLKRHINVEHDLPLNLTSHVAIVTGGTRGLGLTVVRALISKGCRVFVATSQPSDKYSILTEKICDGIAELDEQTGVKRGKVDLMYLDLSSMNSVSTFVQSFKQTKQHLNYLICNAGIMFAPRQITEDNFESHLAVNYLGHCLLTLELLPDLRRASDRTKTMSRIINVSSSMHRTTRFRFDDLLGEANYSSSQAYSQSKLAQIMFSIKLSRYVRDFLRWNNVQTFSLHPGVVLSDLYEHVNLIKYLPFLVPIIKLVTRNIIQGAETTLYAALSPELNDKQGVYLQDSAVNVPSAAARNVEAQERLWELTKGLLSPWLTSDAGETKKTV